MSSTHTDPVFVSPATQISAALTKVAARMFDGLWLDGRPPERISPEIFEAWQLVRSIAHLYGTQGLVYLDLEMIDRLADALLLAHRCAHGLRAETPAPECRDCELAALMTGAMTSIFSIPVSKSEDGR